MTPRDTTGAVHCTVTVVLMSMYVPFENTNSIFSATYTVLAISVPKNASTSKVTSNQQMQWIKPFLILQMQAQQMHDINNAIAPRMNPVTPATCNGGHATT